MKKLILCAAVMIGLGAGAATAETCYSYTQEQKYDAIAGWAGDVWGWHAMDMDPPDDEGAILFRLYFLDLKAKGVVWRDDCVWGRAIVVGDRCEINVLEAYEVSCSEME